MMNWRLVRAVSRSFYLTLRLLPPAVREPIALGYLLARASDSIADASTIEVDERIAALERLRDGGVIETARLAQGQTDAHEGELLRALPDLMADAERSPDREELRWVWQWILEGQLFDLRRFPSEEALTEEELERYTYLVAGCVGEFWTLVCMRRLPRFSHSTLEALIPDAVRYGQALQRINILRDRDRDAAIGRIYVRDFDREKTRAREDLAAGLRWVAAVRNRRVRFACLLPLRIGERTLDVLESDSGPIKISRRAVREVLWSSLPALWSAPIPAPESPLRSPPPPAR